MRSIRLLLFGGLLSLAIVWLVWIVARDTSSEPYGVPRSALSRWTIEVGQPGDPWIVAARASDQLASPLLRQITRKRPTSVTATGLLIPLILRGEYEDGLQGVHSVDTLVRFARDAGLESATFEPICLAHKRDAQNEGELLFVVLESQAFRQFRQDVIPAFPEHAGTGFYDSGALRPVLIVGATGGDIARWWPLAIDEARDCEARIVTE